MIWIVKIFLYSSSVYSCHFLLISSTSVRSIPFLSFIVPIFAWNVSLVSLVFLKQSLVFPILLFSSVSFHWSPRKAFISLLAILWNSAFKWVYFFLFSFAFHVFFFSSAICKASSQPFCLFALLFLGDCLYHCLLYNVMNLPPKFFRHSVYQIESIESICYFHCITVKDLI